MKSSACVWLALALSVVGKTAFADTCVPRAWTKDNAAAFALRSNGTALTLCARGESEGLVDQQLCWRIDPTAGALTALGSGLQPGHSIKGRACALGYCAKPNPNPDPEVFDMIALSNDGGQVAVMSLADPNGTTAQTVELYDARTKKLVRTITLRSEQASDETAQFEGATDLRISGTTILIDGWISGAGFRGLWQYRTSGEALGQLHHDPGHTWDLNVSEHVQINGTTLVARDTGYQQVTVDVTSGERKRELLPRPRGCTERKFATQMWLDNAGEPAGSGTDPKGSKSCESAVRKAQAKFWKPLGIELDGTSYTFNPGARPLKLVARTIGPRPKQRTIAVPICRS